MYWKLNRIQYPIYNLGSGKRIGIWVQGCSLHCVDCLSPSLWAFDNGKNVKVENLLNSIIDVADFFDGITISGGEPFEQYESLIAFCSFIKMKTKLTIFCFSGYILKEIKEKHADLLFMKYLDFLLDGRYIREKHENLNSRGSNNQNLYHFVDGNAILQKNNSFSKRWSLSVKDNQVFMSGIPKENELNKIKKILEKEGIKLEDV
ncbi:MAG: radical SAM protein [Candidatus Cloacimonetes bacterium]|nr:radical SAM protein [Candidatus Cloacimonadota bacterium]